MGMDIERVYVAKTPIKVQGKDRQMIPIGIGEVVPGADSWSESVKRAYINGGIIEEIRTAKPKKEPSSSKNEAEKVEAAPSKEDLEPVSVEAKAIPRKRSASRKKTASKKGAAKS